MLDVALNIGNAPAGIALVPGAVEVLGGGPKLHNEIGGQVLGRSLADVSRATGGPVRPRRCP